MQAQFADRFDPEVAARLAGAEPASAGGLPGFLGITVVARGPGVLPARIDVGASLLTPFGAAHGGVLAALVDHVLGAVCYPLIPRGACAATTEFKINYLAPVRQGPLEARAQVVSLGERTAVVRIEARAGGELVGIAQAVTIRATAASSADSQPRPKVRSRRSASQALRSASTRSAAGFPAGCR
jgi:1,4-dihydroxy-2-naphthoyl-CoA hydrolase